MGFLPQERSVLYASYKKIAGAGSGLPEMFYSRLFEEAPSLKPLFKGSMQTQGVKWRLMLNTIVSALDSPADLEEHLRELGRRHARYGVKREDYVPFVEAVLWAIRQYLGADYTPEVDCAWRKLFALVVELSTRD